MAIQLTILSVAIIVCALIVFRRRKVDQPAQPQTAQPVQVLTEQPKPVVPRPAPVLAQPQPVNLPTAVVEAEPSVAIDLQGALATTEDRNERILAGISKNIQKSLQMRPVPQHSPIPYSDLRQRSTEYIRVKKDIITPHGHIRFSILKDWVSMNMLAVFRRASLEWKTPDDLISFLPAYLEANADVLDGQVLLIGTAGHNERLAVPIRSLDETSAFQSCFEFVADKTATNTPAVLAASDMQFDVVSRGVITKSVFSNALDRELAEAELVMQRSPEALQKSYSAALRRMETPMVQEYR